MTIRVCISAFARGVCISLVIIVIGCGTNSIMVTCNNNTDCLHDEKRL